MKTLKSSFLMLLLTFSMQLVNAQSTSVNNIDKITNAYLGIKNALVDNNGTAAKIKATELFETLSKQPGKGLSAIQEKLIADNLNKLLYDSRHISETTLVDHQREHFESLSKNLSTLLKGLNMNTSTLYEQYCPMKKAYWLSETAAIKNPYNSKMSTCGKTSATLAAVKK